MIYNKNLSFKEYNLSFIIHDLRTKEMLIKGAASGAWRVYEFYKQGFSAMKLGKTLWKLILIKLFVIFVVLKFFVFDANLNNTFANDTEKSEFVLDNLTHSVNLRANSSANQANSHTNPANLSPNSQEIQTLSTKNPTKENATKLQPNQMNSNTISTFSKQNQLSKGTQ